MSEAEDLKEEFVEAAKKSVYFHVGVVYEADEIKKISVLNDQEKPAFTVHTASTALILGEIVKTSAHIILGKKMQLSVNQSIDLSHLLLSAGELIGNLNILEGNENEG